MFLLNMIGALVLLPALGYFLLRPVAAGTEIQQATDGQPVLHERVLN
jgi:hypothetical protein